MQVLNWISQHPVLGILLALIAAQLVVALGKCVLIGIGLLTGRTFKIQ